MNISLAQINPIVGDLAGNFAKVRQIILDNSTHDLIVFPELTIVGYPPNDLLLRRGFVEKQFSYLVDIRKLTVGINATVVIGAATSNLGRGQPLYNSALVFRDGVEILRYHKQLLPTYNVFDERRYFEPGLDSQRNSFVLNGKTVGLLICEDCWNDEAICDAPIYDTNPVAKTFERGDIDFLVTINASPSHVGKSAARYEMYQRLSNKYYTPIVYVNQVGGQDSLIFDGASFICSPKHTRPFSAPSFGESVYSFELQDDKHIGMAVQNIVSRSRPELVYRHLALGLKDYCKKNNFTKVVIGSSGGIDSAVALAISKLVLGKDNVIAITMPGKVSSFGSVADSDKLCKNLDIKLYNHPIEQDVANAIADFQKVFDEAPKRLTIENIQPRVRMRILMEYSNQFGALVVNTTNKSEASVGYGTIYGDVAGGVGLLLDLYKMEVYALAKWINEDQGTELIPKEIIDKEPSAELWEGQKDTDSLPPYPILDALLELYLERDLLGRDKVDKNLELIQSMSLKEIKSILRKVDGAEYKRRVAPPAFRVHPRAFGFGRNLPISQKHEVSFENVI